MGGHTDHRLANTVYSIPIVSTCLVETKWRVVMSNPAHLITPTVTTGSNAKFNIVDYKRPSIAEVHIT